MEERYRRMKDKKLWPGLALKQDFAKKKRLKQIVKKCKCFYFLTF